MPHRGKRTDVIKLEILFKIRWHITPERFKIFLKHKFAFIWNTAITFGNDPPDTSSLPWTQWSENHKDLFVAIPLWNRSFKISTNAEKWLACWFPIGYISENLLRNFTIYFILTDSPIRPIKKGRNSTLCHWFTTHLHEELCFLLPNAYGKVMKCAIDICFFLSASVSRKFGAI